MKIVEVKRGNVVVKIYTRHRHRNGRESTEHIVSDMGSGRRKLHSFAALADAKEKAVEVAEAIQRGQVQVTKWERPVLGHTMRDANSFSWVTSWIAGQRCRRSCAS
ncbi:MAG TPA: hypothetical protein VK633_12790 [Verrucomicrobiae bacterium]|nr:hypothetical protein [Verrucomicrobiae bacterium]